MLNKTIEINKKLLPLIKKKNLEKDIQMRIMKRVSELKKELKDMENAGPIDDEPDEDSITGE